MVSARSFAITLAAAALTLAPAATAQPSKVIRVAFPVAESGFDPQAIADNYSSTIARAIFEPLYTYDYFARPAKLVPAAAEAPPEVSADLTTYTIRLRKGLRFADDPAFGGKPREVTAQDYVYSWKRLLDPKVRSYFVHVFENRLAGGDEAIAKARATGAFDYDAPIAGLTAVDPHTIRVRFTEPYYAFRHWLTTVTLAAVAREVVDKHKDASNRVAEHPVGSGPYRLAEWRRSQKIVLDANPNWRDARYPAAIEAADKPIAAGLTGRKLPLVPRVEISIIEEPQPRLLSFERGEIDMVDLPSELAPNVLDGNALKPAYAKRGIGHTRMLEPALTFTYFNLDDPVVGGYTPEKIALRRAIGMAYDNAEAIRVLLKGRAVPAEGPIPPGIEGHDPKFKANAQLYDPAAARALLDKFGYRDRNGDGWRELPDGRPLVLERWSSPNSAQRQADELWKKNLNAVGLNIEFRKDKLPELRKMARQGRIPMRGDGWNGDYPDAENFMQLLYGPNAGQENYARFNLPAFNKLYDQARAMPDSPARTALFTKMTEVVLAYAPWRMTVSLLEDHLAHRWVTSYVPHPIRSQTWMYTPVDDKLRAK